MNKEKMKALHEKYKDLKDKFREHEEETYPYTEEDNEGIATYLSPHHVEMVFKGITPSEGYRKTINRFKLIGKLHKTMITLEGDKVVVVF